MNTAAASIKCYRCGADSYNKKKAPTHWHRIPSARIVICAICLGQKTREESMKDFEARVVAEGKDALAGERVRQQVGVQLAAAAQQEVHARWLAGYVASLGGVK